MESSSHPFLTLSLLSCIFGLHYVPSLGFSLYSVSALSVYIQRTFGVLFVLFFLCFFFMVVLWFVPLDAYVQIYSASVSEDHRLVVSFGGLAVSLSSLLALSLQCRGHLTAAI